MDVGLVCDSCSAFNQMGARSCIRCGTPVSLDTPPADNQFVDDGTRPGIPMTAPGFVDCPTCGAAVVLGNRFCGQCGSRVDEPAPPAAEEPPVLKPKPKPSKVAARGSRSTQFFGAMQASRAKLVVIRGDGMDGVSFTLAGDEHLAGREDTPILFEDDKFISPIHANFYYDVGNLMVRDQNSVNGVYIRIEGSVELQFGDRFLVGEQVLEVREPPGGLGPQAIEDGTYFFASPADKAYFLITQALLGGASGLTYHTRKAVISIGRESNDMNFPDDPFISGHHAQLSIKDGKLSLTDLDSKNGTFLRINGEHMLKHGDYVFMGQQLLRVEIV